MPVPNLMLDLVRTGRRSGTAWWTRREAAETSGNEGELGLRGCAASPRPEERAVSWTHFCAHADVIFAIGFQPDRSEEREPIDRGYELANFGVALGDLRLLGTPVERAHNRVAACQVVVLHGRAHDGGRNRTIPPGRDFGAQVHRVGERRPKAAANRGSDIISEAIRHGKRDQNRAVPNQRNDPERICRQERRRRYQHRERDADAQNCRHTARPSAPHNGRWHSTTERRRRWGVCRAALWML